MRKWSFWSFILRRLSKARGFLDPVILFSSLQRFGQPSEVWVPTELLRSGAVLQARGLINSQAIQHNLDWVWPFWAERQFNPTDKAFIPRAFSISHINLTHRNWTAIGIPDFSDFPIIDPRGLVTPFFDGWSLDGWVICENFNLIPSRIDDGVWQKLDIENKLCVFTTSKINNVNLRSRAEVKIEDGIPFCEISWKAIAPFKAWLVACLRPCNPEGVSFIHDIKCLNEQPGWNVNEKNNVYLSQKPFRYFYSNYACGDILEQIVLGNAKNSPTEDNLQSISCPVGMASSAAAYDLQPYQLKEIIIKIPLSTTPIRTPYRWEDHLEDHCKLRIPDPKFKFLYDVALRTLILHSPGDVYPGPYTYKRFWFRDAAFILPSMITVGLLKNINKILDGYPSRQKSSGYFMSQDGEWDSNGQALWTFERFSKMTNTPIKQKWLKSVYQGARWIQWKRLPKKENTIHSGLLPAGFSAEHFGPSDFYYWDDFWAVAGLRAAASLTEDQHEDMAQRFRLEADDLLGCIEKSLRLVQQDHHYDGIPSSPYRRMDGASVGALVASYPLQLWSNKDQRILKTIDFLMEKYFLDGCFFHEISHSGINVYLTLHIAQALLRLEDPRFFNIVKSVASLATSTGQWPEAIHPKTKGGCMGDGQHVWAAAEWVMIVRNMFVREEENSNTLILCSGIPQHWLKEGESLFFGPVLTVFGKILIRIDVQETIDVSWEAKWFNKEPTIQVHLPRHLKRRVHENQKFLKLDAAVV